SGIVTAAGVISPPFAGAEQDAGIGAGRRLAHLHVETVGMKRDFARDRDTSLVRAKVIVGGFEIERSGQLDELAARAAVKHPLGAGIVGYAFAKIEDGNRVGWV